MKAAVLTKLNSRLAVCDLVHNEPSFGQVLVAIQQSGICGAQLQEIRGDKGNEKYLPHCLGHEAVGKVLRVGGGVTRVSVGQKVVCHWRKADGCQAEPARYFFKGNGGLVGGGSITTFQEQALISENRVTPVPDDTSNDLCAMLGCGLSTALMTLEHEANLMMGERILILGCGGLGANLILAAKLRQASYIVAVDRENKAELAYSLGAHLFFGPSSILSGRKFDVIVDTTGSFWAVSDSFKWLDSGGRYILVGQPRPNASIQIPMARSLFDGDGKRIIATQGGGFKPDRDIPRYVAMWKAGLLSVSGLVTHYVNLEDINDGIDLVREGLAGRVMVTM